MHDKLAFTLFEQFMAYGTLVVIVGNASPVVIQGAYDGPKVTIRLASSRILWRIIAKPDLAIGEAYMDGSLTIANDELRPFLHLLLQNSSHWSRHWAGRASLFFSHLFALLTLSNRQSASRRNVAHHYDLTDTLFDSFLDPRRQYSCAYFNHPKTPLALAQNTKIARVAAKLNLGEGDRILDIGCGWGGLALALTQCERDVYVTGITLSPKQLAYAQRAAAENGLGHRLDFALRDYRQQTGKFDKIVSVGMLEHVGPRNYQAYFRKIKDLLCTDGIALIHSIGVHGRATPVNRWLTKYIFPGGYLPSLDQMVAATELQGLKILDIEIIRGHYAETLKAWQTNFHRNIHVIRETYDDRFIRMWDFYLAGCEYFFRTQHGMVFQLQLAHDQMAAPANRRYLGPLQDRFEERLCRTDLSGRKKASAK